MNVLLLSGGVDSLVCLYSEKFDATLFVDYGQPASLVERRRSQMFSSGLGIPWKVATISASSRLGLLGQFDATPQSAVVPGRNAMFVALAALSGATRVTLGCNGDDQEAFPDCRRELLLPVARCCGVELSLPLVHLSKREVVAKARAIGAPFDAATTCYRGTKCGQCAACILLAAAVADGVLEADDA